jgi:hypothetical protein
MEDGTMKNKYYTNYRKNFRSLRDEPVSEPQNEEAVNDTVEVTEEVTEEAIEEPKEEDVPRVVEEVQKVPGTVGNCTNVNVRKGPSIDDGVICILSVGTKVTIDLGLSTDEYYYVTFNDPVITADHGYINKAFVVRGNDYE